MSGVQSIERAFTLLRALATGPAGVTDLADRVGLPKSTVSRLLSALETEGVVEQVEGGTEYTIGVGLLDIAGASSPDASIGALLQPFLLDLAARTSGSAGFTIRDGDVAVWIDNVDAGGQIVHVSDMTGSTFPLHVMPSGISVLSAMPDDEVDAYLAGSLPAGDDLNLDDAMTASIARGDESPEDGTLRAQIEEARRQDGLVVSVGRHIPDVTTFAGPLVDSGGVIGGLYLQGPSFRFPEPGAEVSVRAAFLETLALVNERLAHR